MATTVVLVRHGQAEPMSAAPSDLARKLTPAGLDALKAGYPSILSRLAGEPTDEVELWVSPATRARMTAEVIAEVLDISEMEEHESIFYQDIDGMIAELKDEILASEPHAIICVGHVPSMEDLAYEISGSSLGFSVGSVAAIELDPSRLGSVDSRGAGKLLWFERGPEV